MIVGILKALFTVDASKFDAGMNNIKSSTNKATKHIESANRSFLKIGGTIAATGATAVFFAKRMTTVARELEAINQKLRFATGSSVAASSALAFLTKEAGRLGISLETLTREFGNFSAAAKGTELSTSQVREIFTSVAEASAVLRLDARKTELAFLAITQMMSKGKVAAEELNRQLGDHLPGAVQIFARALNVSSKELLIMMQRGGLLAEEVLPKFAKQLRIELNPAVKELDVSLGAAVGRLETAWFFLKRRFFDEGTPLANILASSIKALTVTINSLGTTAEDTLGLIGTSPGSLQRASDAVNGVTKSVIDLNEVLADTSEKTRKGFVVDYDALQAHLDSLEDTFEKEKSLFEERHANVLGFMKNTLDSTLNLMQDLVSGSSSSFKDFANSILKDILRIVHQLAVAEPMMQAFRSFLDQSGSYSSGSGGLFSIVGKFLAGSSTAKTLAYADGGMISEPVTGVGLKSGNRYMFGEEGKEAVIPLSKMSSSESKGTSNNINLTINAIDSRSLTELMRDNPQAVTMPLIDAIQSGDRGIAASIRSTL